MIGKLKYESLDLYGFDISDFLNQGAINAGIDEGKLKVANAIQTGYDDKFFYHSYSIGSLEHFTEEDIDLFFKRNSKNNHLRFFSSDSYCKR